MTFLHLTSLRKRNPYQKSFLYVIRKINLFLGKSVQQLVFTLVSVSCIGQKQFFIQDLHHKNGIRSMRTKEQAGPGTTTPCHKVRVPKRQEFSFLEKRSTSAPQFWQTTDSTVVQGALQRLVTDR